MEKPKSDSCTYFQHLLWNNELEYNRRELAIFESFLMNKGSFLPSHIYNEYMEQLYELLRSINKIMAEIQMEKQALVEEKALARVAKKSGESFAYKKSETCNLYIREEMFYYEQNYRQFRKRFFSLVGSLESV